MEIIELNEKTRKAMAQCLRECQWDDFDAVEIHPGKYDAEGELDHCGDDEKSDCYMIFLHLIDGGLVDLTEAQCLDAAEFIGEMVNNWLIEHSTRPIELV